MPKFDGTGPRGQGPMTGRSEGYCALAIPDSGQAPRGYVGLQGTPVRLGVLATPSTPAPRFAHRLRPALRRGRAFGRGRGRGRGRRW